MVPNSTKQADEEKKFRDCADLYEAGIQKNGVYTINISPQETKKVRVSVFLCSSVFAYVHVVMYSV